MKQNEKIKAQEFKKYPPKLKGHATIQLFEDGHEVERIEEDNLVTDAVATIFASQFFGNGDLRSLTPVRNLYGGIYAFQNSLEESASNVRPPAQNVNPLVAHAGQESHATASPYRGNPNAIESGLIQDGKGYKFVWDWNTSQGNGTINALALTMSRFGNTGFISSDANQSPLMFSAVGTTIKGPSGFGGSGTAYKRDHAMQVPRTYDPETGEGLAIYPTSTTLEFIKVRANTTKFFLNDAIVEFVEEESQVVNLTSSKSARYSALVEDDNNYYYIYIGSNGTASIAMDKISKSDYTVTSQNFSISSGAVARFDANNNLSAACNGHPYIICDDRYLYLPSTDFSFYRVELANTTNVIKLNSNLTSWKTIAYTSSLTGACVINEGLIAGCYFIINGDEVTETTSFMGATDGSVVHEFAVANRYPALVKQGIAQSAGETINRGVGVLPYLATINNLASAVTKTPSQTMKITYSLTQVEE